MTGYELTFVGGADEGYAANLSANGYRRYHATFEDAREEALRVLADMDNRAAHPAIIYGPDLNKDGVTVP